MGKKRSEEVRETPLTYDDYQQLPDKEGVRYELVDGALELMIPGATAIHQLILLTLYDKLARTCQTDYLTLVAPLDVILSEREVRQPDLIMIHHSRLSIITNRGVEGPPVLVAEVLSPSSVKRDKLSKMKSYARYNIPEHWIVDPNNEVLEQYVLSEGTYTLHNIYRGDDSVQSDHVPCVSYSMNDIINQVPHLPNVE